ncbi:UMP-CMP kinase, partial [Coemansia spiralis]
MDASSPRVRSDHVLVAPAAVPLKVLTAGVESVTLCAEPADVGGGRGGHPMIIGIGGGRGAGKAYTCRNIIDKVRERGYGELAERVVHLHLDDFHRELDAEDRAQLDEGRAEINFDHPESFDFELLEQVLQALRSGAAVDVPQWDGRQRRRTGARRVGCRPQVVLVEGTLVLFVKEIRALMNMQVFVDVDSDTRLGRQVRAELR